MSAIANSLSGISKFITDNLTVSNLSKLGLEVSGSNVLLNPSAFVKLISQINIIFEPIKPYVIPIFESVGNWFLANKAIMASILGWSFTVIGVTAAALAIGYVIYKIAPKIVNWILKQINGRSVEDIERQTVIAHRKKLCSKIERRLKSVDVEAEKKRIKDKFVSRMKKAKSQEEKELIWKTYIEETSKVKYCNDGLRQFYTDLLAEDDDI